MSLALDTRPAAPDFTAIKQRQQATWASGDFAVIGTTLQIVGELLAEAADIRAGVRIKTAERRRGGRAAEIKEPALALHAPANTDPLVKAVPHIVERPTDIHLLGRCCTWTLIAQDYAGDG